jgi:sulfatase modifying factor 1
MRAQPQAPMLVPFALVAVLEGCGSRTGLSDGPLGSNGATTIVTQPSLSASASTGSSDTTAVVPPSCSASRAGTSNCNGGHDSCCTSLEVPGGTYDRTYKDDGSGATQEADPATVSGFRLDKYDVTVGRYRQYVNYLTSGAGAPPPDGSGKHTHLHGGLGLLNVGSAHGYERGWDASDWSANIATGAGAASAWNTNLMMCGSYSTWTSSAAGQENLPIDCVTWYEAYAFCIWDGGFLPSEAEWEYAAAGGNQQRQYPWGTAAPGTSSQYAIFGCFYPNGSGLCPGVSNFAPVGTATTGAGRWGQCDLAGEVSDWSLDVYAAYVDPCGDCANMDNPFLRISRGGAFDDPASSLSPSNRGSGVPSARDVNGVRCARTP